MSAVNIQLKEVGSRMRNYLESIFSDEVYLCKNINSILHCAMDQLQSEQNLFHMGTILINPFLTLVGLLELLYQAVCGNENLST